jgi:hypothetical protein
VPEIPVNYRRCDFLHRVCADRRRVVETNYTTAQESSPMERRSPLDSPLGPGDFTPTALRPGSLRRRALPAVRARRVGSSEQQSDRQHRPGDQGLLSTLVIPGASVLAALLDVARLTSGAARLLTAAGVGFWLSALNIQYRDVKYVVPFLLQLWMYASPAVYSLSLVPQQSRLAYSPSDGRGHRWLSLGVARPGGPTVTEFWASLGVARVVFVVGARARRI